MLDCLFSDLNICNIGLFFPQKGVELLFYDYQVAFLTKRLYVLAVL